MRAVDLVVRLILLLPFACGAEPAPRTKEPPVAAALVLEYEGMTLGSSLDELVTTAAARGWKQNSQPVPHASQTVTVFTTPDHPVYRYKLGYQAGSLINIQIAYREPDKARLALRDRFATSRLVKDMWFMSDADRQILASVDVEGGEVRALYVARLEDQTEAKALLRFGLGD
jgi:hypothetical protein